MRYFYFLFLLLGLTACGSGEDGSEEQELADNFHIEGRIEGAPMQKIKIEAASQAGVISVAETTTDADGKFILDGNVPGLGIYSMTVGGNPADAIVLPLDVNDRVTINTSLNDFARSPKISGPSWAKPLTTYMQLFNEFAENLAHSDIKKLQDQDAQLKKYQELRKPLESFVQKQVSADPGNNVNIILTTLLAPSQEMGLANWDPKNLELLKKIETAYQKKHRGSPVTATLTQQVAQIQAAYDNYARMNSGTLTAPEIAMKNPSGTELRLSSLKGKVVLIDFWASWCAPCRRENPNVVRLYKKFRSEGFEVFSVSLDQDANAWKTAIARDGLIWPNHVSDLMGWQTPLTQVYGFNSIPYTVLLNREGNIVGTNLRGKELEQKLEQELVKK
jgi:thiol-disulfide isomerase/thioredoxin